MSIANLSAYSIKNGEEMAYEIEYTSGSKDRAIEAKYGSVRLETLINGEWVVLNGANNHIQAEAIIMKVKRFFLTSK